MSYEGVLVYGSRMRDPDPYVLYTVMRRSLKMHGGKIVAQGQHAFDYVQRHVDWIKSPCRPPPSEEELALIKVFRAWRSTEEHAKVVLGATDEEYEQVKRENPLHFSVTDLGFTQVAPNTETCLALWPMRKSERSPILQVLRPL